MPGFRVVLVEPKIEGNIGAVARAMSNFGVRELRLVNPPPLGDEAFRRSKSGRRILEEATRHASLEEALAGADFVVGSSAVDTGSERKFLRQSMSPTECAERVHGIEGTVALLLGREDYGLYTEELERCDMLVTIATDRASPVMNISHAAAILLYELARPPGVRRQPKPASGSEKERLLARFDDLLEAIEYPAHKRKRTSILFRRLMGRATPSKWEFHALMGVLGPAAERLQTLRD